MKICQVIASSGVGGLERHVIDLSEQFAIKHDVTLIAPAEMRPAISSSVNFIAVDFDRSRYNPFLYSDLLRIFRQGGFDIIHAQANKAVYMASKMKKVLNAKLIGTLHNTRKNKGKPFKNLDHAIAVSQEAALLINPKCPTSVIYNGIKVNQTLKTIGLTKKDLIEAYNLTGEKVMLCSIGRLVDAKGFDLLIDAMQGLDAHLLIIGDGELMPKLKQQIKRLKLDDKVVLTGHRPDVMAVLKAVDGMVISSRNEGFSYVFVEALRSKVPIISTDVSAKEFLPNSLIMHKEPASIHQKIKEFGFNIEDWQREMAGVYERADKELTLDYMANQTSAIYRQVLQP